MFANRQQCDYLNLLNLSHKIMATLTFVELNIVRDGPTFQIKKRKDSMVHLSLRVLVHVTQEDFT